jgi:hypothetical protein
VVVTEGYKFGKKYFFDGMEWQLLLTLQRFGAEKCLTMHVFVRARWLPANKTHIKSNQ